MLPYLPKWCTLIYRNGAFLFTEVVHSYLPILVHCYLPITMSHNIYLGIRGDFPIHTFTKFDFDNIEFWAGFYDDTIAPLNDMLQDDYLKSLCEPLALYKEVEILEDWSDPIQIPKGLGFKMTFSDDKKICYKIFDSKNPQNYNEHAIERNENHYKIYRYNSDYGLTEMEQPAITFKLPDNNYNPSGISLLFVNE